MPADVQTDSSVRLTVLPNGLRVATETMPHVRSVSLGVWVKSGSRSEDAEHNGISHFIEHMVFKGTSSRSAEDIARSIDSVGGHLDAFTTKELISFNTKVLDEHLELACDILSDLVLNPLFNPDDVEKEKGVVLEELKMDSDNAEYLVHEIFSAAFWKGHALGRPILGTKDTIRRFSRDSVVDHYRSHFTACNTVITAAGNVSHERVVDLVAERFDGMTRTGAAAPVAAPKTHAKVVLKNKASLEQVHMCLGVPAHPFAHPTRFASYILNTVLGGGMSSRLFQTIREKLGLAYSIFTELNLYRDSGCLAVCAGTSLESLPKVLELVLRELRVLKTTPLPADELQRAKDNLKGSLMLSLESTNSRMGSLARQEIYFGRFFTLDEMLASIDSVTAEQVLAVAETFFHADQMALSVLGNLGGFRMTQADLVC